MSTTLLPPLRRRRARFLLTPLVDVMFLLLIFFMLSSETSLFTLLRLSATASTGAAARVGAIVAPPAELLVSIGRGELRVNGAAVTAAELPALLDGFKQQGLTTAALLPTADAEAQDIVTTIELFEAAAFGAVRLVAAPAGVP